MPVSDFSTSPVAADNLPVITIVELIPKVPLEGEALGSLQSMIHAASQFEGYVAADVYKKLKDGTVAEYAIILQFDRYSNLYLWNNSLERKQQIALSKHLFAQVKPELALIGLFFWFANKRSGNSLPIKWKMMVITVIIILFMLNMVMPLLDHLFGYFGLTGLLKMLLSVMVMVSTMTYLIMPAINILLYPWLFKNKKQQNF